MPRPNELTIEQEMERVEKASLEAVYRYLRNDNPDEELLTKARVAQSQFASIQRRRQSDGAREALYFGMARSMTDDPAKLAEYIRVTSPSARIVKALPPGPTDVTPEND